MGIQRLKGGQEKSRVSLEMCVPSEGQDILAGGSPVMVKVPPKAG